MRFPRSSSPLTCLRVTALRAYLTMCSLPFCSCSSLLLCRWCVIYRATAVDNNLYLRKNTSNSATFADANLLRSKNTSHLMHAYKKRADISVNACPLAHCELKSLDTSTTEQHAPKAERQQIRCGAQERHDHVGPLERGGLQERRGEAHRTKTQPRVSVLPPSLFS